ncbi:enoyl-CoA hydratase/carnithine racemase [Rheinheimera pacifica]|uniref:enoyl-CoA hydratase n=1 Tax=Rheinheimera pacifica TaxID=173990 RepID=UPI0021681732|nr:enoyl-CoA hydratase [Rheinheimera pacifica]MCS4307507.1 enoyl-CoA hydratase/carnithine racemase [Rheinheimera pacifica]
MSDITQQITQGVLQLSLNRPHKKNALSQQMYRDLNQALMQAATDPAVKVVLLQGSADCFSAGNDLQDFIGAGELNSQHPTVQFLYILAQFSKPVVAAVAGLAIGIGTTVLLHCDLVYAADSAHFQLPFTQLGLCPEAGSSVLLPNLAGYQRAAQYLLLGEAFGATEAVQIGLVNQVVTNTEVAALALEKAVKLAALPADAVQSSKALLKRNTLPLTLETIATELVQFQRLLNTNESQQRISAFFKR